MLGKLRMLVVLVGAVEAARRYAKANPDAVGKLAGQAGQLVDQFTKGRFSDQINGAVRRVQDATGAGSA